MRRYTTPTVTLTVKGVDLTGMDVLVTFTQACRELTVDNPSMTLTTGGDTVIEVPLSQVQTGGFVDGSIEVQVNWLDAVGHRDATTVGTIEVERNLLARVVEDE